MFDKTCFDKAVVPLRGHGLWRINLAVDDSLLHECGHIEREIQNTRHAHTDTDT